ncbi:MAG: serine--tRNA ligase [Alphaproteobacteria bacterium]|nr:serine--tRNA ligase [Alphaproteobacteria bacterium]
MHDLKFIRENPEAFDGGLAKRGVAPVTAEITRLDAVRRERITEAQGLQQRRNALAKEIGQKKAKGESADELMEEAKRNNARLAELEAKQNDGDELDALLATIPNVPLADVPQGKDENDNKQVRAHGQKPSLGFAAKQHFEIGEGLGLMDFDGAAGMSGARFTVLKGALARLERALGAFMLDIHTKEFGYTEVSPPLLVQAQALYGTGQLPKFEEDLFKTQTGHYLIPTAEVSLTNIVREKILEAESLPLRFTALTPCFRSEAGSAGRDTRGMLRQHQFQKVELVSVTRAEDSEAEHERMTACAEEILKRLGLHFRTMMLCTGDMGFSARKTYDIEVWLPGQETYREISSCSNCGDFQARRMKARYRAKGEKETKFAHTLNGSGLAVGRTLIAVLENYQQADGSVVVPEVLKPYLPGVEKISA